MDKMTAQEKDIIDKLTLIRDDYIKTKELNNISIRKDVLLVELKDILDNQSTYYGLKNAIEDYINKLEVEINDKSK